jgi:TorA maturation chaperone TorD
MKAAGVRKATEEEVGMLAEECARANVYALLASLFYAPPPAELLRTIAAADVAADPDSRLARSWRELQAAAGAADPEVVRQEYDDVFVSVGRPPVLLYESHYLKGALMEAPLVTLRAELAHLGIALRDSSFETEDHISAVCDVMRFLIAGDGTIPPATIEAQHDFFVRHIAPWYSELCDAIAQASQTDFYKHVASFAKEFFQLEAESFSFEIA